MTTHDVTRMSRRDRTTRHSVTSRARAAAGASRVARPTPTPTKDRDLMTSNEPTVRTEASPPAPMTDDLEFLINHHQDEAIASGNPPLHLAAWRNACRVKILANEYAHPGYTQRAAAGLRARAQGQRITGWRATRGTHGIDYRHDPQGTDRPPWI